MTPATALGRIIAMWRISRGLKRRELAQLSELSYPYLSEIENGAKEPTLATLRRLAQVLNVAPSELIKAAEYLRERE